MTRPITPHKGGRTARAPEARIKPQTLQRIRATMQEREVSFADLLEEHFSGGNDMETVFLNNNNRVNGGKIIILGEDVESIVKQAVTTHRDTEVIIRALISRGSLSDVLDAVVSCAMRDKSPSVKLLEQAAKIELMK